MKKKRRKKKQTVALAQEKDSQEIAELLAVLEELKKQGKRVDVQVCPRCKSPRVRRLGTMSGDLWGHMGILPSKFECEDCGWRARLVLKATNRPLGIKDVAIIAEASESKH